MLGPRDEDDRLTPALVQQMLRLFADQQVDAEQATALVPVIEATRRRLALLDRFDVAESPPATTFDPTGHAAPRTRPTPEPPVGAPSAARETGAAARLHELTAAELGPLISRGVVSPVEVVRAVLARLDATEPTLNCFISRRDEAALEEAQLAEVEIRSGAYRGPLHGVPVAVKDNIAVAGTITTAGARVLADNRTDLDAEVVRRLREAGAIVVGKTNLHEFAAGPTTINPHFGTTRNPWRTDHIAGGSSGGSAAAVAARQVPLALGTDHAGSIRIPASLCGIVGLKPTHGRVSLRGLVAARNVTADHIGPLARTVTDAALLLQAIAGYDPADPGSIDQPLVGSREVAPASLVGARIGVPRDYYFDLLDPEVESGVSQAIEVLGRLGATVISVALPDLEELMAVRDALNAEGLATLHDHLQAHPEQFGADIRLASYAQYFVSARDLARANRVRRLIGQRFLDVFEHVDLLATPTTCVPAFPVDRPQVKLRAKATGEQRELPAAPALVRLTSPANLTGIPAISVPAGFTRAGLPFGLQLQAPPLQDVALLSAALAFEQTTRWFERVPDLPLA
jgi:aspartyl-tRNA(Asn)/glutamyl-tRNA(Gln) amidotransferase subunit A